MVGVVVKKVYLCLTCVGLVCVVGFGCGASKSFVLVGLEVQAMREPQCVLRLVSAEDGLMALRVEGRVAVRALFFLMVGLYLLVLPVAGQERSERVISDSEGHSFYVHRVKREESLYGLSRLYNVTQSEILKHNPQVDGRIRRGQDLRIPYLPGVNAPAEEQSGDVLHQVGASETLYSIARKYGVSVDDLRRANGLSGDDIGVGEVLRIPLGEATGLEGAGSSEGEGKANRGTHSLHMVRAGETLYSLSRMYGLSVDSIRSLAGTSGDSLKVGQLLLIPHSGGADYSSQSSGSEGVVRSYDCDWQDPSGRRERLRCYDYEVRAGDAVYGLARSHGTRVEVIYGLNPGLFGRELQVGERLRLPYTGAALAGSAPSVRRGGLYGADQYTLYVSVGGDDWERVAQRFSVSVDSLKRHNSRLVLGGLSSGSVIVVPVPYRGVSGTYPVDLHVAVPGETVYSLRRSAGVIGEYFDAVNRDVLLRGLLVGDTVYMPLGADYLASLQGGGLDALVGCGSRSGWDKSKALNISLLLPFRLRGGAFDAYFESLAKPHGSGGGGRGHSSVSQALPADLRFVEFYQGVLLAVRRFQSLGYDVRLRVYDTDRSRATVDRLLQSGVLADSHLIIGPVYPEGVGPVMDYAAQNRIAHVSPLSSLPEEGGGLGFSSLYPEAYHANPRLRTQLRTLAGQIQYGSFSRVVILKEESVQDWKVSADLRLLIDSAMVAQGVGPVTGGIGLGRPTIGTVVIPKGNSVSTRLSELSRQVNQPDSSILVVIPSTNEVFVTDAIGQLSGLKKEHGCDLYVVGLPSWQRMTRVDFSQLSALKSTIFTPFFVDYSAEAVKVFLAQYRDYFRSEPTHYSFQGWDLFTYFVEHLVRYGEDFCPCVGLAGDVPLLQNRFDFRAAGAPGTSNRENSGVFLLRYDRHRGTVPLEGELQGGGSVRSK